MKQIEHNPSNDCYTFSLNGLKFVLKKRKFDRCKDFFLYALNSDKCIGYFSVNEQPDNFKGLEINDNSIVLDEITVPFLDNRMRGYGTFLLNMFLAEYADKNIYLMVKPFGRHFENFDYYEEMKRLESWYKSYGFITFDENKDRILMKRANKIKFENED